MQKYLEHRVYVKEAEQRLKHMSNKEFCGDCKKYFDTPEDYLHHLNEERRVDYEEMKKYPCKFCNFTYLDSITLSKKSLKVTQTWCSLSKKSKAKLFWKEKKKIKKKKKNSLQCAKNYNELFLLYNDYNISSRKKKSFLKGLKEVVRQQIYNSYKTSFAHLNFQDVTPSVNIAGSEDVS